VVDQWLHDSEHLGGLIGVIGNAVGLGRRDGVGGGPGRDRVLLALLADSRQRGGQLSTLGQPSRRSRGIELVSQGVGARGVGGFAGPQRRQLLVLRELGGEIGPPLDQLLLALQQDRGGVGPLGGQRRRLGLPLIGGLGEQRQLLVDRCELCLRLGGPRRVRVTFDQPPTGDARDRGQSGHRPDSDDPVPPATTGGGGREQGGHFNFLMPHKWSNLPDGRRVLKWCVNATAKGPLASFRNHQSNSLCWRGHTTARRAWHRHPDHRGKPDAGKA
jgi:hypothetical protein